ncbi:MAG: hypothetical protein KatS3mg068_1670 [Candidatus Sericytochromatia bacterium]|nr:MAG: hypothetical protein KatS3mg068_1670 [Candidatus Sericytochromatia bacterium]
MTSVGSAGYNPYQYQNYNNQYNQGYATTGVNPYGTTDGYMASPYATGYMQGANAIAGPAMGISSMVTGISSMTNSIGGILGTICNLVASIINSVIDLVVGLVKGVLGLFGIGKDKGNQNMPMNMQMNPNMQMNNMTMPNHNYQGIRTPAGSNVPPPPPGTDINVAYNIVAGDLANVRDPNQGIQIVDIHALKAKDYREKAEQFAKEAEKEAREAAYAAEELQRRIAQRTGDINTLVAKIQQHKSKAMELLKTSQEYTKAVYDEALYAQAANDILSQRFGPAFGTTGAQKVFDAWKNWIGGYEERKFLIFKDKVKPAPEVFMNALNAVNANIGRATQVLQSLAPMR